jgi:hypothetical protein
MSSRAGPARQVSRARRFTSDKRIPWTKQRRFWLRMFPQAFHTLEGSTWHGQKKFGLVRS